MNTSDFDYDLPPHFIAQTPIEPRHNSRLLILDRESGLITHDNFYNIGHYLQSGDILVLNETRVIAARLLGRKVPTGGKVEILLLRRLNGITWEVLVGGKGLAPGKHVQVENGPLAQILVKMDGGRRIIRFSEDLDPILSSIGIIPLPPYIHTSLPDPERYQTVYARTPGSAAAPTAGLHFTSELISQLKDKGILFSQLILHVGLDTFSPVKEEAPETHHIHSEWCQIGSECADLVNQASQNGSRVIAVGTTSVRTLETAARLSPKVGRVAAFEGSTDLFILPGFNFRAIDAMITNFHLPRSTLIMMVSAFAGRDLILSTYEIAKQEDYRFYSFGDVMLIL